MKRLSADEEILCFLPSTPVKRYLGKTSSAIEVRNSHYFYDVLHMSCELLEYLAEYCTEGKATQASVT